MPARRCSACWPPRRSELVAGASSVAAAITGCWFPQSAATVRRPCRCSSCWTRLQLVGAVYEGDLRRSGRRAAAVRGRRVRAGDPAACAGGGGACRSRCWRRPCGCCRPGGLLVLSGVHPLSLWTPWLAWRVATQCAALAHALATGRMAAARRHAGGERAACWARMAGRRAACRDWAEAIGGGYRVARAQAASLGHAGAAGAARTARSGAMQGLRRVRGAIRPENIYLNMRIDVD